MEQRLTNIRILAALIVTHFLMMNIAYWLLGYYFDFPEILRRSPAEILALYTANQGVVRSAYYLFTLTGLSFFAIAFFIFECCRVHSAIGRLAMAFGCIAGLFTSIGFVRWTFVIPELADIYAATSTTADLLPALEADLQLIHSFAGVAIGENLAFVLQGLWLFLLGVDLAVQQNASEKIYLPCIALGMLVLVYSLEQFGGAFAWLASLNIYIQASWLIWLLVLARAMRNDQHHGSLALSRPENLCALGVLAGFLVIL